MFESLLVLFWIVVLFSALYAITDAVITYWPSVKKLLRDMDRLPVVTITWKVRDDG